MGQTLTHGVYLPDEGERNCYAGLAANWQILDNSVGTIASHTTQIAGKANAVHTHTKSDITDFPAYGNAAGTICEGNDSRLSDARTPVSHTHTKSDVTDLLNSDFIPSVNNSYNLGSSSYQWNNLYAKNYFYNGTAWGLDKSNVWTNANHFTSGNYNNSIMLVNSTLDLSQGNPSVSETNQSMICLVDNSKQRVYSRFQSWTATDQTVTVIGSTYKPDANSETDFSVWVSNKPGDTTFHPYGVTNPNLGNSTYKWKTLNGINPGALSLPRNAYDNINTNDWVLTGASFTYTPQIDGYLQINVNPNSNNIARVSIEATFFRMASESSIGNNAMVTIPVRAGISYGIRLTGASIAQARITPAEGNI